MNSPVNSDPAAKFAWEVVEQLQHHGYQALWAGGCVRDQLLGVRPKDYDVATDATPEQVREVFGRRRTLFIGAAFGVVSVRGPRRAGHVEVATFRQDGGYSDGRRPDQVSFSDAREDALRRDFTINGLFYDPLNAEVIDYVEGQADLRARRIRCIGDAHQRFAEDKLRMLRAVRFATLLGFEVDRDTLQAVTQHADELSIVSAERIAAEMRRILASGRASLGLHLLRQTGLWRVVWPEWAGAGPVPQAHHWPRALAIVDRLHPGRPTAVALAGILWPLMPDLEPVPLVAGLARRWRLTNQEAADTRWLLEKVSIALSADRQPWPEVQPVLVDPRAVELLELAAAIIDTSPGAQVDTEPLQYCRTRLAWPPEQLNPPPLVNGDDLQRAGIPAGKQLGKMLRRIRAAQLDGQLVTSDAAIRWAKAALDSQIDP